MAALFGVVASLLALANAGAAQDKSQEWIWCKNEGNAFTDDLQINGCTAIIQAGHENSENIENAYFSCGSAYLRTRQYDRAILDFDRVISLQLNHAGAFNNRGFAPLEQGQYDRAIQDSTRSSVLFRTTAEPSA